MRWFLSLLPLCFFLNSYAQQDTTEYVRSYGAKGKPALIFLHGGPGYNAAGFEFTTADSLAARGYFVVVYDQRGGGRSTGFHGGGPFTFDAFTGDLNGIYARFGLKKATLLGHSWGGTLATRFAQRYPDRVERLVFLDAPAAYQMSFRTIQDACAKRYAAKSDTSGLKYIGMLRGMDSTSLAYSSFTFIHAMNCGLYRPAEPTPAARELYLTAAMKGGRWLQQMDKAPVQGLFDAEHYTMLNLLPDWAALAKQLPVYFMSGSVDGLFDEAQLAAIRSAIGSGHTFLIPNASHNVFIDNQPAFLGVLEMILDNKFK